MSEPALAAWKLPPIVAAIAVSIVGGFYLGGPGLGMAVGALAAAAIVVMAVRHPPVHPINPPVARDSRRHILVILSSPLGESQALETLIRTTRATAIEDRSEPEILVVAPSHHRFLDRWTSDSRRGRERAQQRLVLSLASLAKARIEAGARVGDEDVVQTTEDELRSFPATEVVLVTGAPKQDAVGDAAAAELEFRLQTPFHRLCVSAREIPQLPRSSALTGVK